MAMSTGHSGGRGRRGHGRRGSRALVSEINVTPFVDVMLVLLIIFMVAAPMMTFGIPIDLPETEAGALSTPTQPIKISVDEKGTIHLQEIEISYEEIIPKLQAIATTGYDERILVLGAKSADYGLLARVVSLISKAGYRKLGLETIPEQSN